MVKVGFPGSEMPAVGQHDLREPPGLSLGSFEERGSTRAEVQEHPPAFSSFTQVVNCYSLSRRSALYGLSCSPPDQR
jgi:hypothetical protein